MGKDRLAKVSPRDGINLNSGVVGDEIFVTRSSRHEGDEPCIIGGCSWKA